MLCLFGLHVAATAQVVSGRVTNRAGEAVPSALVVLENTSTHAFTNPDGTFSLTGVPTGIYELLVVHVGYHSARLPLDVPRAAPEGLDVVLTRRAIPLGTIRARAPSALTRWRRAKASAHHAFIARAELDRYELRGAAHVGDALRLHTPTAVRIIEKTLGETVYGPTVCVMSARAVRRGSLMNPAGCARVMVDGFLISRQAGNILLYDLPVSDAQSVEFLPPMEATTRFGHVGSDGVVAITTRRGSELATQHPFGGGVPPGESSAHASYVAIGAGVGFLGAFGAAYGPGLFDRQAEFCTTDCGRKTLQLVGAILIGAGLGELLYRSRRASDP
jgi:hypothetical protein